jgi:DNA polymerase-3 subunit delta'
MNIVLNQSDKTRLALLSRNLPQSTLLTGERGVGLGTIAKRLAGKDLATYLHPQNSKEQTDDENGTITVEMIRRLYDQTRAKHTSRQVIIIDNANTMSGGAQAAFLKLLEEPNGYIHFILTSHSPQKLVATIRSRVQETNIHPITKEQTLEYIKELGVSDTKKQALLQFIAAGLPAELSRLASDDSYFAARAKIMTDARTFLQSPGYEKLLIAQEYQSERTNALQLIDSCLQIVRRSMSAKPQQALIAQLSLLLSIHENISRQYNIRLQLTRFVL